MAQFTIDGFKLWVPNHLMNENIKASLAQGRYESAESNAVAKHLTADDRVLELGGGTGYIAMQIASCIGGENLLTVEANTKMVSVIEKNLEANLIEGVTVVNAAVVPDGTDQDHVTFHMTAAFWASSLDPTIAKKFPSTKSVDVPAVKIGELMDAHKPTAVVMDIEGGERGLFDTAWPAHVRLLVIELHPRLYPDHVIKQIFDQMSATGLTYCPNGSRGDVVVFKRVNDSA